MLQWVCSVCVVRQQEDSSVTAALVCVLFGLTVLATVGGVVVIGRSVLKPSYPQQPEFNTLWSCVTADIDQTSRLDCDRRWQSVGHGGHHFKRFFFSLFITWFHPYKGNVLQSLRQSRGTSEHLYRTELVQTGIEYIGGETNNQYNLELNVSSFWLFGNTSRVQIKDDFTQLHHVSYFPTFTSFLSVKGGFNKLDLCFPCSVVATLPPFIQDSTWSFSKGEPLS